MKAVKESLRIIAGMIGLLGGLACCGADEVEEEPESCCGCTEVVTDLTQYDAEVAAAFTGVFEGEIEDRTASGEYERVPCEQDGAAFSITVTVADVACTGIEDEEDVEVSCANAARANYRLEGVLDAGDGVDRTLTGTASLSSCEQGIEVELDWSLDYAGSYPIERLELKPEIRKLKDPIEMIHWDKRQTADGEEPAVWEMCSLRVSKRDSR